MNIEDINTIFSKVFYEFPVERIAIKFPKWIDGLDFNHSLKSELINEIKDAFSNIKVLRDVSSCTQKIAKTNIIENTTVQNIQLGSGFVNIKIDLKKIYFILYFLKLLELMFKTKVIYLELYVSFLLQKNAMIKLLTH